MSYDKKLAKNIQHDFNRLEKKIDQLQDSPQKYTAMDGLKKIQELLDLSDTDE